MIDVVKHKNSGSGQKPSMSKKNKKSTMTVSVPSHSKKPTPPSKTLVSEASEAIAASKKPLYESRNGQSMQTLVSNLPGKKATASDAQLPIIPMSKIVTIKKRVVAVPKQLFPSVGEKT